RVAHPPGGATATNGGVDYALAPGTLTFRPGQTMKTFPVAIANDMEDEGTETVVLQLGAPVWSGGTAVVGSPGTATLRITDNEPTVQFGAAAYSVSEAAKSTVVTVRRTGPLTAAAPVDYHATRAPAVPPPGGGGPPPA